MQGPCSSLLPGPPPLSWVEAGLSPVLTSLSTELQYIALKPQLPQLLGGLPAHSQGAVAHILQGQPQWGTGDIWGGEAKVSGRAPPCIPASLLHLSPLLVCHLRLEVQASWLRARQKLQGLQDPVPEASVALEPALALWTLMLPPLQKAL